MKNIHSMLNEKKKTNKPSLSISKFYRIPCAFTYVQKISRMIFIKSITRITFVD